MVSHGPNRLTPTTRSRVAALTIAGLTVGYAFLSVWYFYEDFFKYLQAGAVMSADRSGWQVSVAYPYLWSVLSPWRIAGAALTVALLGVSAQGLWLGRPRARAFSLLTLWGVLLPQVLWGTEFVSDWYGGAFLGDVVLAGALVVLVPSVLVYAGARTLRDWNPAPGSARLLGMAVAMCWLAFGATEFLDHAYQFPSWLAYGGAMAAVLMGAMAARGLFELRAWALWMGVAAAGALALVPLSATWSSKLYYAGDYVNQIHIAATASDARIAVSMLIPLAVVWALGAPYLHGFLRKLKA
ncbi:hypothetical protein [Haliangium sp.]|uniref:hypothetical protein n=1 Tax=Haliangium sp. TaxID=2663208 RepID=UPI003D12E383